MDKEEIMLETQIPKDIRKYESKLVGPFTLRQLICFIIACLVAYIVFKITKPYLPVGKTSLYAPVTAAVKFLSLTYLLFTKNI